MAGALGFNPIEQQVLVLVRPFSVTVLLVMFQFYHLIGWIQGERLKT
jgi:hypothetical protein